MSLGFGKRRCGSENGRQIRWIVCGLVFKCAEAARRVMSRACIHLRNFGRGTGAGAEGCWTIFIIIALLQIVQRALVLR